MKKTAATAAIALLAIGATAGGASAEGKSANAPGKNSDAVILFYQVVEPTGSPAGEDGLIKNLGGAISGGFYGNTSNSGADSDAPANGRGVTPSVSPGPSKGGCAGVQPGASLGYAITGNGPSAVGKTDPNPC